MNIKRVIALYDRKSEEYTGEVNIDHVDFGEIRKIFNPSNDDHLMYNPYEIGHIEASKLKDLDSSFKFYFDKYWYYVECYK